MAPFRRGRGNTAFRVGRGGRRGRGGRGSQTPRGGFRHKSTFEPTRIEQHPEAENQESDHTTELEHSTASSASDDESEEEEGISNTANPYSALLQSLASSIPPGPPPQKKRKINGVDPPAVVDAAIEEDGNLEDVAENADATDGEDENLDSNEDEGVPRSTSI